MKFVVSLSTALSLLVLPLTANSGKNETPNDPARMEVLEFVAKLKADKLSGGAENEFRRRHIEELLNHAKDVTLVSVFPSNPISSFAQRKATIGMVTMWIVEGIRKEGGNSFSFPSLNPMCFKKGDTKEGVDWEEASIGNQKATATSYLAWWSKASDSDKVFKSNPFEGTDLHWY